MATPNRRQFLGSLASTSAAPLVWSQGSGVAAAEDKIRIGVIGCGWYGGVDAVNALKAGGVEVIGLCDADTAHLEAFAADMQNRQGTRPKTFKHHRELLEMPRLQAVILASPPQWHALQYIDACRKGLHIYAEKPLSYDIREGRAMVEAAKKAKGVIEIGFQRRQSPAFQQVTEYIGEGKLGRIVQADVQIHYTAGTPDATPKEPPATLDWDLWCGPAPKWPYSEAIAHRSWRLAEPYGNGHLVDWGIHLIDATRLMLGLGVPKSVTASGGIYQLKGKITTPDTLSAHFEFERCPVVWRHRLWGASEWDPQVNNGIFLYGEKATIFVTDSRWVLIPNEKSAERKTMPVTGDTGLLHVQNWLNAIRGKAKVSCTTEEGYLSSTTVQLGMISYKSGGTRVIWDAEKEEITGNAAAARRVKREYRDPYQHPWAG
jgi:predicted dehydrogenase